MHYDFNNKMDRVSTLSNPDFNRAEVDWFLNEAHLLFAKRAFSPDHKDRQRGFEVMQKSIDEIAPLSIKYPVQPAIALTQHTNMYEADLSNLAYDLLYFIRGEVDATSSNCVSRVPLKFVQSDDISEALKDPFNKSSLDYILYTVGRSSTGSGESLYLYPGTLTLGDFYPEYIKYPRKVYYGGYTYIDGTVTVQTNSELPESTHPEIVDIAVALAAANVQSPELLALKNAKLNILD